MVDQPNEAEFLARFKALLKQIQGERTDADMADLLGVSPKAYSKYKTRVKSGFPIHLLPKLRKLGAMSYRDLLEGPADKPERKPAKTKRSAA